MLAVDANQVNARKIIRLATKHKLNIDQSLFDIASVKTLSTSIDGFNFTLKKYQAEGVAWLESQLGSGLLADEQGTGKTITVLAYAHKNRKFPMLIVCPNTLKFNWRNEIIATTGQRYKINIVGKDLGKKEGQRMHSQFPNVLYSKIPANDYDIYVINYENLQKNLDLLLKINFQLMAVDESHKIKNISSQRTQAYITLSTGKNTVKKNNDGDIYAYANNYRYEKVAKPIPSVILMSGTPMVNRPVELFTSVSSIGSYVPEFSAWRIFAFKYCNPRHNSYGWDFSGSSNTAELNALLTKYLMLRRLKQDVLTELPSKIYSTIPLEFNRTEYDKVAKAFDGINWTDGIQSIINFGGNPPKSNNAIVAIQKLREIAAYAKLDSTIEWINDFTEEGQKLVVFAHNREIIEQIKNSQKSSAVRIIYGGMTEVERETAVNDFQLNNDVKLIVVGISAGGYGLTLTAANAVAFVQLPWTPGEISQCTDRVHRIGQTASSVNIYNLVAEGTIEETITNMLIPKGTVMDAVLDNQRTVNAIQL